MEEIKKKVDESWKDRAEKEKEAAPDNKQPAGNAAAGETGEGQMPGEPDFSFFVTSLALQASISLGSMPHPSSNKVEENLDHAKLIIDTLGMLKEKTLGNLSAEEDSMFENILYELRMQYVAKTQGRAK